MTDLAEEVRLWDEIKSLREQLEFAQWECNRAIDGMKERDVTVADLRRQLEKAQMALRQILAIEDSYNGSDWCEINEARDIAKGALPDEQSK